MIKRLIHRLKRQRPPISLSDCKIRSFEDLGGMREQIAKLFAEQDYCLDAKTIAAGWAIVTQYERDVYLERADKCLDLFREHALSKVGYAEAESMRSAIISGQTVITTHMELTADDIENLKKEWEARFIGPRKSRSPFYHTRGGRSKSLEL